MKFLEKNGLKTAQTRFRDIFQSNIHRNYADDLLAWLERETDFFEAPASTRNHGAHPGGLLVHSLNVYRRPEGSGGQATARTVREDHLRQVRPPALWPPL